VSQIFRVPSLHKQDTWYPTLRKTVWVLEQLHDFVKPAIFEDIAQEALSFCHLSLINASELLKNRNTPGSTLEGCLFFVRHLLILKEIMHNLEADLRQRDDGKGFDRRLGSSKAVEFASTGGVTASLSQMFNKTTSLFLFASLGGVEGDLRGVKVDIDQNIRRGCEDIIAICSRTVCEPLEVWTGETRAQSSTKQTEIPSSSTPALKNWVSEVDDLNLRFREACERNLRSDVNRLRLYLEDQRTVHVLLDHVQERVMHVYAGYRDLVMMMGGSSKSGQDVLSVTLLRELLKEVCGESKA